MTSKKGDGQVIDGKYRIERRLGKGGMGSVFLATHIGTGRPVAVKLISAQFMQRAEFVARFRREAQAAGRLRHPNVVDVTDFGFSVNEDGSKTAYLVMEYLDGCTLGEVLDEEKRIPLDFTIDILEQVCSAVHEAHRQGIIHRDLKPDNIWLEPNQRGGYTVKVLDFGIAKLEETRFAEDADDSGEFLVRDGSKNRLSGESTSSGAGLDSKTLVAGQTETLAGEGATLSLGGEDRTVEGGDPSEAGTVVQEPPAEENPNPAAQIKTVADADSATAVPGGKQDKGTRLINERGGTDDPADDGSMTSDLTRAGAVLGTPLYMSPEQCRGEKLTPASDIYSLAVIVYQMISGGLPFNGDYLEVMDGHKTQEPPPLKTRKIPKKLTGVVMTALSKDAGERPESAEALGSKLRSNSEGLGVLLRMAIVMYAEHLPKFVLLTFVTFIPVIFLTFLRVGINIFIATTGDDNEILKVVNSVGLAILTFFVQTVVVACLIGMTTWIVGRVLAYPLRPISLRSAIREVKNRWKSLAYTVTASTLLILVSFGLCFFPGIWLGARYMMIAPSVMMEGLSGRDAFRRSVELYKRAKGTMLSVSFLNLVIPAVIAIVVGFSIGSIIQNIERSKEIDKMKREGVVAQKEDENKSVNVKITPSGTISKAEITKKPDGTVEKKSMTDSFSESLQEGIFEIIWTPIALLIVSFSTVLTALIYFKLRQAGGESLQTLLGKLEDTGQLQSKWEQRVRERLIQSGKVTGGRNVSNP